MPRGHPGDIQKVLNLQGPATHENEVSSVHGKQEKTKLPGDKGSQGLSKQHFERQLCNVPKQVPTTIFGPCLDTSLLQDKSQTDSHWSWATKNLPHWKQPPTLLFTVSKTGISQLACPQSLQQLLCSSESPQLPNARMTGPWGSAEGHPLHMKTETMYMMTEPQRLDWLLRHPYVFRYLSPPGLCFNSQCSKILVRVSAVRKAMAIQQRLPGVKSFVSRLPPKAIRNLDAKKIPATESRSFIHFIGPKICSEPPHPVDVASVLSLKAIDWWIFLPLKSVLCWVSVDVHTRKTLRK